MSEVQSPAGLRDVLERRPLLAYVVAIALGIALYELFRFLGPAVPAWVTPVVAAGAIASGLVLMLQQIRRPLRDEGRQAGWAAAPSLLLLGVVLLLLKYASAA